MPLLDNEQEIQLSSKPLLVTDKGSSDYDVETHQNSKSEDKENFEFRLTNTFDTNTKLYTLLIKMYHVLKELSLLFLVALTYAALTNNPPKISKSPPAVPFFPTSSIVQDWYRGELNAALAKARLADIAFVMFYAPWNAESQAAREQFDAAARYLHKEVMFMAVNCWQPGSECRIQYSKSYTWPVFIAYLPRGKGIHYTGIISAAYMVKFLTTLSRPLVRIYHENEIDGLLAANNAVVLGCLNASPGSVDYSVLYNTALHALENEEPLPQIVFAVLTGTDNNCAKHNQRGLSLHLWNETLIYPHDRQWKLDAITTWIKNNVHQVSAWTFPTGAKSVLLSTYIQPGPTLILFTPRNPLVDNEDYYNLLREVALEYYDCSESNRATIISLLTHTLRIENYLKHKKDLIECGIKENVSEPQSSYPFVVTYTLPKNWVNNTCCHSDRNHMDSCLKCDSSDILKDRFPSEHNQRCSDIYQYQHGLNSNIYKSCDTKSTLDSRSDNSQNTVQDEKCRRIRFAQKIYPIVYSETIQEIIELKKNVNIVKGIGLACQTNASLTFIALDSLQQNFFAERLGLDLLGKKDRTAAVIVNDKMETHHIMHEVVNDKTLRQFIINFTNGNLARTFNLDSDIKPTHTHVYSSKDVCSGKGTSEFCLTELNSKTFLPTVLQQGQVVIVLYYSKQCAFCSGISYKFLTVAKMFSAVNVIKFVRIDGDLNALPWEFTMESFPTILFFPYQRKSETRVYPQNMPITVSNIISFILSNLNPTLKLHAMQTLCNQTKQEEDRLMCTASIRSENLALIDHTLRAWRNADVLKKAKLLHKLQQLRNINLLLALYPQNNVELNQYLSQLHWSTEEEVLVKIVNKQNHIKDEL